MGVTDALAPGAQPPAEGPLLQKLAPSWRPAKPSQPYRQLSAEAQLPNSPSLSTGSSGYNNCTPKFRPQPTDPSLPQPTPTNPNQPASPEELWEQQHEAEAALGHHMVYAMACCTRWRAAKPCLPSLPYCQKPTSLLVSNLPSCQSLSSSGCSNRPRPTPTDPDRPQPTCRP